MILAGSQGAQRVRENVSSLGRPTTAAIASPAAPIYLGAEVPLPRRQ